MRPLNISKGHKFWTKIEVQLSKTGIVPEINTLAQISLSDSFFKYFCAEKNIKNKGTQLNKSSQTKALLCVVIWDVNSVLLRLLKIIMPTLTRNIWENLSL